MLFSKDMIISSISKSVGYVVKKTYLVLGESCSCIDV